MDNIKTPKCDSLKTFTQQNRLNDALRLLDGISRLPLRNNTDRADEVRKIYGEAEKTEKFSNNA